MPRLTHWPQRWTLKNGSIYYRTTREDRHRFDDKSWFRLGQTESEAYETWWTRLPEEAAPVSIGAVIHRYRHERLPLLASKTQIQYQAALTLLDAVFGAMSPRSLLPVHCYDYRAKRPRVLGNREIAVLSALMTFAVELGCVERNLVREVKRSPEPPRNRYVDDAELDNFLSHCSPFLQAYVALKLLTGVRQGQLLTIRLTDWDGEKLKVVGTKGGKDTYYGGEGLAAAIEACLDLRRGRSLQSIYLFSTRKGQRYSTDGFRSIWQRVMRKYVEAGGERFTEHDLRAKVASDDPENAQTRLQHRSSAMVRTVYDRRPAEIHVFHRAPKVSHDL